MAVNIRIGTAKFLTIREPVATRIHVSEQPKLLSRAVKSKLFETLIPFSEEYKQKAADLYMRINLLSGGNLEHAFEIKSDDIDGIPFRLLNPKGLQGDKCDESSQEDKLMDSYVAASYCWQQSQGQYPRKDQSMSGHPVFVALKLGLLIEVRFV